MDRGELFSQPVTLDEAPDYYDVIKEPMSWVQIDTKLKAVKYLNVADFKVSCAVCCPNSQRDIYLVLDNAMQYNKGETTFHRTALRIKKNATPLLDALDSIPATGQLMPPVPEGQGEWAPQPEDVGDLETSLARLQTLLAPDPSEGGREQERDMLRSIFAFEVEKEPPPPPSPKKRKTMSAAERNKKFEQAEERYKERLSMGGGSARVSRAAAAATGPESPPPPTTGRRKASATSEVSETSRRSQPGVVGVTSVPAMSERERRQAEKNLDLIAENLDSKDEYERFNVGWILPEGSKRRRPAPVTLPPPPKRTSRAPSSTSAASKASERKRQRTTTPGDGSASKKRKGAEAAAEAEAGEKSGESKEEEDVDAEGEDEELTPVPDSAVTPNFPRSSLSPPPADAASPASDKTAVNPTPAQDSKTGQATGQEKADEAKEEPMDVDGDAKNEPKTPAPKDEGSTADSTPAKDRRKSLVPPRAPLPSDGSDPYPAGTQGESIPCFDSPKSQADPSLGQSHLIPLLPRRRHRPARGPIDRPGVRARLTGRRGEGGSRLARAVP